MEDFSRYREDFSKLFDAGPSATATDDSHACASDGGAKIHMPAWIPPTSTLSGMVGSMVLVLGLNILNPVHASGGLENAVNPRECS